MTDDKKTVRAWRVDQWDCECPKCSEIIELGDQTQAQMYVEDALACDECGAEFYIEWDSVNL